MVAPDDLATLEAPAEALLEDDAAPEALTEDDRPAVEDDDEEEEEVEPSLDALLTGILAPEERAAGEEDDDGEEAASGLEIEYVPTARRDEFVCSACFLIWNRRQLADAGRRLCLDCIDDIGRVPATGRCDVTLREGWSGS